MAEEQEPSCSSQTEEEEDSINIRFQFGSVVVAKLGNFPWWPAMVDPCPETGDVYWLEDFEDLSKKNASHYHVVFFDVPGKVTRSWVHSTKITPYRQYFPDTLTEKERKAVKNHKNHTTKRRLVEARSFAEAALLMPIEERRKKYSFIYTFKGKITLFDDDGNEKVLDGGRFQDVKHALAEKVEPIKIRKKPGPKPKNKDESGTSQEGSQTSRASFISTIPPAEEVESIKIRKKPGPKPKNKDESGTFEGGSQTERKRRIPRAHFTSTIPPDDDGNEKVLDGGRVQDVKHALAEKVKPIKIRKKPGPKPKNKDESGTSQEGSQTGPKRRTSRASFISTIPPDTKASTTTEGTLRSQGLLQTASISPPSSKPASVPRATQELAQELSVFAAFYPVAAESDSSLSPRDVPKRKGKKRKTSAKIQSNPGKKCSRKKTENTPTPEIYTADSCVASTPIVSETPTRVCSPVAHIPPNTIRLTHESLQASLMAAGEPSHCVRSNETSQCLPSHVPTQCLPPELAKKANEMETESKTLELKTTANLGLFGPSENSLENQMTTFLNRIQSQTSKLKYNGKTISNLNLLVAKTEEGDVIDLTGDDEEVCHLRYGELVYANLKGLQPWPAMVVMDPEINVCFIPENGAPNYVHVFFFLLHRRAWVPIENVMMFEDTRHHPEGAEMLNYGKYCKALALAQQVRSFSREQRTLQFPNMQAVPMTGGPIVPIRGSDENIIVL